MVNLLKLDLILTLIFKNIFPHNVFFNIFFSFFSIVGSAGIIWIVMGTLLIAFEEIKHHKFIFYFATAIILSAFLVNFFAKNIVRRPRPYLNTTVLKYDALNSLKLATYTCPKDFSFPSGHSAVAFSAACILAFFDKKRSKFYYLIALVISFSRIYLGCHYFFDVAFGALSGYIISKLVLMIKIKL